MQALLPVLLENCPAAQLVQALLPVLLENCPVVQLVQVLLPVLLENSPALQLVQVLLPVLLENCPAAQLVQALLPVLLENCPVVQLVQVLLPVLLENCPASQSLQLPPLEYRPDAQSVQFAAPPAGKVTSWPAEHKLVSAVAVSNHSLGVLLIVPSSASTTLPSLVPSPTVSVPGSDPDAGRIPSMMMPPAKVALCKKVTDTLSANVTDPRL
jgi:hypothetical protein